MLTLRRKILFTLIGVFCILILLFYAIADRITFTTMQGLEDQFTRRNVKRGTQVIQTELANLAATTADYAIWDDTFKFIQAARQGPLDPDYAGTNFSDSNLLSNRLNLLIYVNSAGEVVFQKGFDLEGKRPVPVPPDFFVKTMPKFLQPANATTSKIGIVDYAGGLMLVAAHPILPNTGLAPNRGSVIFGRLLNATKIKQMAELILFPVAVYPLSNPAALPADAKVDLAALTVANAITLHPLSDNEIFGYTPLFGVDGQPIALLQLKMPRSIHEQGHINLNYMMVTLILLVIIFGLIVSYTVNKWVLTPVTALGLHVNHIGASANLSTRLKVTGNDELTRLTQNINQMLDALETAQHEQQRSEARYRAIFEQASEGIVFADASTHQLIAANPAFLRLVGYNAHELAQLTAYDLVVNDKASYAASIKPVSGDQQYTMTEHLYRRKDGEQINVESSAVMLPANHGQAIYCMVVRNITERVQAETKLRQTQKLESIGLLAGGIAHDFNNLLTGMLGQTSLALDKLTAEHPAWSNINKAVISARRAADLTRQLLAYAGRGQFLVEAIDVNQLIDDNVSLLETALTRHVYLQLALAPDLPTIDADRGQIQQIVMNLVINAAEAIMTEHGTVTITTNKLQLTAVEAQHYVNGDQLAPGCYVCLQISDTGIGMDKETLTRIFDPFFTTKTYGTGLGLSATLGIVRAHNGGLEVTSQVGRGTTFKLLFPASAQIVDQQAQPPVAATQNSSGCILVIDDEKSVREVVRDILEMNGLRVLLAPNGQVGIKLFKEHRSEIDMILLDMQMPVMNGAETFQVLHAIDPQVKVILSSGYNELEATHRFVGQELTAFLQKPYALEDLIAKIQLVLNQQPLTELNTRPS